MTICTLADAQVPELDYCAKGLRAFCRRHGLDFRRFLDEGLPAEDFLKTGDSMAVALVEAAKRREQGEQHGR